MPATTHSKNWTRILLAMGLSSIVVVATAQMADAAPCASASPSACWFAPRPGPTAPVSPPPTAAPAPAPGPAPVAPPAAPAPVVSSSPPRPTTTVSVPDAARLLLDLANRDRAQAGLGRLSTRDDIVTIALEHSYKMASTGYIFHNDNFFTTLIRNLLNSLVRGENVAQNMSVEDAHRRLMNSPGHRANLLDPRFSTVGFAVVQSPSGQYWVTQDFIQPAGGSSVPPATAAPAVARTASAPKAPAKAPVARQPVASTTTTAATTPPTTAAPVPVSVELDAAVLAMVEPVAASTGLGTSRPAPSDDNPVGGVGIVLVVVAAAGAGGLWRLRRSMASVS